MKKRLAWIDAAKGFAIVLVVFGHVLGGMMARGWVRGDGTFQSIYDYIYLFHMPLFFMISGIFAIEAMRKSRVNAFISRTGSIAWPYLFWTVIVWAYLLPLASQLNDVEIPDIGWSARIRQAFTGDLSWFLWTLYVMQVILIPLTRVPIWISFIASVTVCLGLEGSHLGMFNVVVDHMPFLLFGAMLQPSLHRLKTSNDWKPLLLSLVAFFLMGIALLFGWAAYKPVWLVCGIAGSLASICLVQYLGKAVEQGLLANLGIASLAIFVLHPYFQGVARLLVLRTIGASPFWQLVIPTFIAVGGPFLVWRLAETHGISWLFRLKLPKYAESTDRNDGHALASIKRQGHEC